MTIYLGSISGSRELDGSPIDKAITAAAIKLTRARTGQRAPLADTAPKQANLDLTFYLPAERVKPDFKGMRIRHYSVEDGTVFIESAVPDAMLHSEQAHAYVLAVIQDAVENAEEFFAEQSWLELDASGLQEQVSALLDS